MSLKKQKTTKAKKQDRTKIMLLVLAVALIIVASIQSLYIYNLRNPSSNAGVIESAMKEAYPYISLNFLQFNLINGVVEKRTDESFTKIKDFIYKLSADSRCGVSGSEGSGYVTVVAWTEDEKQLLLHFGCAEPTASMYAVNINGEWKTISPTNHFDTFGIPDCDYLNQNNISREIAPVCISSSDLISGTTTSASKYYTR